MDRERARQEVEKLVNQYAERRGEVVRSHSPYGEEQVKIDFINSWLIALGWDVNNQKRLSFHHREVVLETQVYVDDSETHFPRKPDYALRQGGERKLFWEIKRPKVPIADARGPAFQVRRYGWSAKLTVSVLTNFDKLAIYDCRLRPLQDDHAQIARFRLYDHTEYLSKFDEIYNLLSYEAVGSGSLDRLFPLDQEISGSELFDDYFLSQIESWRYRLAENLANRNGDIEKDELNFLVQRLLNRIIFLRICEDRELETYRALQEVSTYDELKILFQRADTRYNSELFDFIEDELSLEIELDNDVLISIFRELYYPRSPFAFAVVDSSILGEIYERFLGKHIIVEDGVQVVEKPEVAVAQGVVPTPRYIVERIVKATLDPLCRGKSPAELSTLAVADISCGSGVFDVVVYEYLLNHYLTWYLQHEPSRYVDAVYERHPGEWHLSLAEKRRILVTHVYGVDVDPQAVEVTRFSLLLKILEDETASAIETHLQQHRTGALPNLNQNVQLGNSLVDDDYFEFDPGGLTSLDEFQQINPLVWEESFSEVFARGGFDAIVGNPPYVRIQRMVGYAPQEVNYFQSAVSPYFTAKSNNFDKYYLFIERGLSLLRSGGRLGYIVSHKFLISTSGASLRRLLTAGRHLRAIVDFGVAPVFGRRRANYTCILILSKEAADLFTVEHVENLEAWKRGTPGCIVPYNADDFDAQPWEFVSPQLTEVFDRLRTENPTTLGQLADIFVGIQTSADRIYIIREPEVDQDVIRFVDCAGEHWSVEVSICRPILYDVSLPPYARPQANAYVIFPYKIVDAKAVLYTEEEMQFEFPHCWAYLLAHKEALERRSLRGGRNIAWYQFGRSQSLTKFDGRPKLIWSTLSLDARYAYDDKNILFTGGGNGPYYALRPKEDVHISIHYLQAILSHPMIDALVRARGSRFRGDYRSHGKQFLQNVPIKQIDFDDPTRKQLYDKLVALVKEEITATEEAASSSIPSRRNMLERRRDWLRRTIEDQVSKLYDLKVTDLEALQPLITDD